MLLQQKKYDVFYNTKTKVYRTGAMALRLEKHTLCAQRKKHTLHTGGTTRDARRATAQNCYFVKLIRKCENHCTHIALAIPGNDLERNSARSRQPFPA